MNCIVCEKEVKQINTVGGKCFDCLRLTAIDAVKKYKDNWNLKAKAFTYKIENVRDPHPPINIFFMKINRWFYNAGETVLDKAVDKAVGKFSWIIAVVLIIIVAGMFIKGKSNEIK